MTTEQQTSAATGSRVQAQPGEVIDRSASLTFTFDGQQITAHPGDTIASALAAAGVKTLSRSFKYHRPRGLLCCSGHCPNCLVRVGDEPDVRACQQPVAAGMKVKHQNAWPSLGADIMSLSALGDRFLPVGFYYKAFIRPKVLWPVYEHVLRHAAGLGEVHTGANLHDAAHERRTKQYLAADVLVIGGGPAGISAAIAAAREGCRVLLFDENPQLGGHLRYSGDAARLARLRASAAEQANLSVYTNAAVTGWYEDNWLSAVQNGRLLKIRAKALVVAAGAYEAPLIFDNSDLPGVMLAGGAQRLLRMYGVAPGRRAVMITANDDGWAAAADMRAAGMDIAAIVDERQRAACHSPHHDTLAGAVPVFWEHTILEALGSGAVSGARVGRVRAERAVDESSAQVLACDLVLMSIGWAPANELAYQAGASIVYDEARAEMLAQNLPPGIFVAGRAAGTHELETQIGEGHLAGRAAAAFNGHGAAPAESEWEAVARQKAGEPVRTSDRVSVPGHKKHIVCVCEDVTETDITNSIAEGFNTLELLKRYATVGMGPCQAKMCGLNSIHLCARGNNWSVKETGITTQRPPITPMALGALAGQHMEPVQLSPLHEWHTAHGATLSIAGLWLRAERYGDPTDEVRAVREAVGVIDVSTLGKLRLTGPGVPALLDRIYVNQWRSLGVGRVRYGVMCNDEGVVLDDGVCARVGEEDWYMTTTSSGASAIYEWIQWWVQSGWGQGVHVTDLTESYGAINLAGPRSREVLAALTAADVSNEAFPYMHTRQIEVAGVACRVLRIGFTGELSYEIHTPAGYSLHVWEALMAAGQAHGIRPFGLEAQRVLRLEKAHIIVSQDTDAATDPLSAGMAWAVKLDKPDFLGKRSLTRLAASEPRQKLVGFKMVLPNIVPEEGLQIIERTAEGRMHIIGWVTSSRYSPTLKESIGLCWLPAALAEQAGAPFIIRLQNGVGLAEARVHHGAFYDPQGERLRQ